MKQHFYVGEHQVACGKNNHNIITTSEKNRVTCIKCRSSHLFKHAVNCDITPPSPEKMTELLPKEFWKKYITDLSGYNRLPRGFK